MRTSARAAARRLSPLVLAALAAAAPAGADLLSGRYQARPGAVVGCGGFAGRCHLFQLEGWVEVEALGAAEPGVPPVVRFLASDLRLRRVGAAESVPFPLPGDIQLVELEPLGGEVDATLVSPPGAPQTVRLELIDGLDGEHFVLAGSYDEGCCDRFRYEIGGVLFDGTGPSAEAPALLLDHGFRVTVAWADGRGGRGAGTPVALDGASGRFWFFQPDNPEVFVKVIDACEPFGRFWFFAAGLTDVEVEIRVDGPAAFEAEKVYTSPAGTAFAPIQDTTGFPCG